MRNPKISQKMAPVSFCLSGLSRLQPVALVLAAAVVLVHVAGAPMAVGIPNVPTHYVYGGENVSLPVNLGRVAIEYQPGA